MLPNPGIRKDINRGTVRPSHHMDRTSRPSGLHHSSPETAVVRRRGAGRTRNSQRVCLALKLLISELVGEGLDDVGAAFDLTVDPFQPVGELDLLPVP